MMKRLRLAFFGFRHGHVMGLYKSALSHPRIDVVAAVEEDPATAEALRAAGQVMLTHSSYRDAFRADHFDAVAIGDYFGRRGPIILDVIAGSGGHHVISDKPVCTDLQTLNLIAGQCKEHRRVLGCLLDLRDHGPFITMRRQIRSGAIGEVRTITITAQHPLMLGKRPAWYFEPGKHGGTINDIGIHAIDLIPWLSGRRIVECVCARAWNARLSQHPNFQDAGQFMLKLDNGGGVLGDVSYLTPDGIAYGAPQYWRVTCHGDRGVIETSYNAKTVELARSADTQVQSIPVEAGDSTGCLDAFLDEIDGAPQPGALTTNDVIDASRRALLIQQAADQKQTNVPLD